jgi:predicted acyltransferase
MHRTEMSAPLTAAVHQNSPANPPPQALPSNRLLCLDIFRGLCVAGMILVDNPGDDAAAYWPIKHADWNGWTPADFIFPSFVFLVGISIVFSFRARLQRGESRGHIFVHAVKRALILIAVGLFVNAFPVFHLSDWRIEGVTQRIAICYLISATLVLWSGQRGQIVAIVACLVGYWVLMRFLPVPGLGVPGRDIPFLDPDRNMGAWLDRKLFMGHLFEGTRDPEGIISTIPAIPTCLFGVLTGRWLQSERAPGVKVGGMLAAGITGLIAGEIWNLWFPINKHLWTSSFAVFTAGFALVFLALLYWALEIRRWRGAWTMPILVFGMNAIAGFVADSFVYGPAWSFHAQGPNGETITWMQWANARFLSLGVSPANASLLYSLAAVLFCWVLLWMLYRKKIFIKI